ncbi:hypothetical protein ZWY2020_006324 [Hordeum vulgare]|nr:hypothetical protein ZWY2020_006324 [Hordeum vulgare]
MWCFKPGDKVPIQHFFGTNLDGMCVSLLKSKKNVFPNRDADIGLGHANCTIESWLANDKKIKSPTPLSEDIRNLKMEKLLTDKPHKVPIKMRKKLKRPSFEVESEEEEEEEEEKKEEE